jgi:hypothetical protein
VPPRDIWSVVSWSRDHAFNESCFPTKEEAERRLNYLNGSEKEARKDQHLRDTLAITQQRNDRLEEWIVSTICCRELSAEQRMDGLRLVEEMNPSQSVRLAVGRICPEQRFSLDVHPNMEEAYWLTQEPAGPEIER